MASASWQQAWDAAQSRISEIRTSVGSSEPLRPRILRVGQLDSELLDQELVQLLRDPLNKAFALVNSSLRARFEPEITLLIQLTLYKFSIWNIGASYGAKLQDLRYRVPRKYSGPLSPSGLPQRTLLIHGALTVAVPYLHTRIRAHALSRAWPDAPSSDRRRKAWNILTSLESSHSLLSLFSFVAFLWDGRYRTIADRLLHMSLIPSRRMVKHDVSYEFMNRQMVWHAFTEFLLFLLPLISTRGIHRRLLRLTSRISLSSLLPASAQNALGLTPSTSLRKSKSQRRGKYWVLPEDQCPICAENALFNLNPADSTNTFSTLAVSAQPTDVDADEPPTYPIYTPYVTSCGHVYCYHCIAERMMRFADDGDGEDGWECLRCGEGVRDANRVEEPVVEEFSESGDDYDFTDMDMTSGSVDSYSESSLSDEENERR